MRNLFNFFWKYHFFILFLSLELVAFTLIVQYNKVHKARYLNVSSAVAGSIYQATNNITDYFTLKRTNHELAQENAKLRTLSKDVFIKNQGEFVSIDDTLYKQQYKYLGAKVINSTTNRRNNILILDKGRNQGVEPETGVICANGIVGVIKDVSANYCSVISVLHKNTRTSASIKKNNYYGILEWEGMDPEYAILKDIPKHVQVEEGDQIITRGSSAIFPAGIDIGSISIFNAIPGSNFYYIRVKLSTDFRNLSYVYIIKNLLKEEQLNLEEAFEDD